VNILGIDTSTVLGAVGIVDGDELVADMRTNISVTHSERLMLHIDGLLKSARLTMDDIDGFAVGLGPGSFTGLRIGVATVKGLAYATGKPVAGVSSLRALAGNLPDCRHMVCPVYDARKGMVYAALYRDTDAGREEVFSPRAMFPDDLVEYIDAPAVFIGEGARVYGELLKEKLGDKAVFAPRIYSCHVGSVIARLGHAEIEAGRTADPFTLTPEYIRRSDAEENLKKKKRA